jgi:hypothetical protein
MVRSHGMGPPTAEVHASACRDGRRATVPSRTNGAQAQPTGFVRDPTTTTRDRVVNETLLVT